MNTTPMTNTPVRLAWITDPHLNHCALAGWDRLIAQVRRCDCNAVVISGDISEGEDVVFQLRRLADAIQLPIHFVLGNHDFYHSSVARTRAAVRQAAADHPLLNYLSESAPVRLAAGVGLIGADGWGDATVGDYDRSTVRLNDFRLIDDFSLASPALWKAMLIHLGRDSAERLGDSLTTAITTFTSLIVATHVPPFRQSCWYQGRTTDDNWAPFFVSGQCGERLLATAQQHPQATFEVICGHTHNGGIARLRDNLTVRTAGAQYGHPEVAGVIILSDGVVRIETAFDSVC